MHLGFVITLVFGLFTAFPDVPSVPGLDFRDFDPTIRKPAVLQLLDFGCFDIDATTNLVDRLFESGSQPTQLDSDDIDDRDAVFTRDPWRQAPSPGTPARERGSRSPVPKAPRSEAPSPALPGAPAGASGAPASASVSSATGAPCALAALTVAFTELPAPPLPELSSECHSLMARGAEAPNIRDLVGLFSTLEARGQIRADHAQMQSVHAMQAVAKVVNHNQVQVQQELHVHRQAMEGHVNEMTRKFDHMQKDMEKLRADGSRMRNEMDGRLRSAGLPSAMPAPTSSSVPGACAVPLASGPAPVPVAMPMPSSGASGGTGKRMANRAFVPEFVYIQGWSRYGETDMQLSRQDCERLVIELRQWLAPVDQWMLDPCRVSHGRIMNARVAVKVDSRDMAWKVMSTLRGILNERAITRNSRPVIARVEDGPERRAIRATRARAIRTLELAKPMECDEFERVELVADGIDMVFLRCTVRASMVPVPEEPGALAPIANGDGNAMTDVALAPTPVGPAAGGAPGEPAAAPTGTSTPAAGDAPTGASTPAAGGAPGEPAAPPTGTGPSTPAAGGAPGGPAAAPTGTSAAGGALGEPGPAVASASSASSQLILTAARIRPDLEITWNMTKLARIGIGATEAALNEQCLMQA
mmetsp:Transcript_64642/g.189109  ORF Transcript_64642/g.189109 Transcript_64642/m.189109 type:complete len:643 (-) Transcript_64642:65-1993(-)